MEETRNRASKLYYEIMDEIKNTKNKYAKIIKFINKNKKINKSLKPRIRFHLKHLVKLWNNNSEANIEYYFKMRKHHHYINEQIKNNENLYDPNDVELLDDSASIRVFYDLEKKDEKYWRETDL